LDATVGLFDQALALDRKALELNPLDTTAYLNLANVAYYMGRYNEAASALKKSLELNLEFPVARAYLGRVYLMQARQQEALATMDQEPDPAWRLYGLALANHALGREAESDVALAALIGKHQGEFAYQIAQVYAYRGDADRAFEWLERAYSQRDGGLSEVKGDPLLKSLERDPRHSAFMKKMNLDGPPQDTTRVGQSRLRSGRRVFGFRVVLFGANLGVTSSLFQNPADAFRHTYQCHCCAVKSRKESVG
jgi:tetratricopeptide (TPR) repeat protein